IAGCICTNDYTGEFCQNPPNLCIQGCYPNVTCDNTSGCGPCPSGFSGDGIHCTDFDECSAKTSKCDQYANCTNTIGNYNCTCREGFNGTGFTCNDINECQGNNSCSSNATCTNTPGSYSCSCKNGFTGNGSTCNDIDECQDSNSCSPNGICTNTPGSFSCSCKDGFTGNGAVCCSACEPNYCSNGGTCTRSLSSCNPVCQCPDAYTGEKCTVSKDTYPAQLNPGTKKRSVYVSFTHDANFSKEEGYNKIKTVLTNAPYDVVSLFDNTSSTMTIPTNNSIFTANFTARFTYIANITVVGFLNDKLVDYINSNKQRSTRSTGLTISNATSGDMLTVSELALNVTCVSGFVLDPATLQCISKCNSYCMNDGTCNLIVGNATCTCKPFTIYVTSGERCENLSMNLNAFFGILFGALAFLFLLIMGIVLGIYIYRKKKSKNDHDDTDQLYQTRFSWKPPILPSFQRLGDKEIPSLNTDTSPDLISWKPHLDKVNSATEVKIKRPEMKPNLNLYE
ncbi:hypothetical protein AB205_0050770, partial [Aquarana catesbeiana]